MLTSCPEEIYFSPEEGMDLEGFSDMERTSGKCWECKSHHECPLDSPKPCALKAETMKDHGEKNK